MFSTAAFVALMPMLSAVIALALAFFAWPDRRRPTGMPILALSVSAGLWAFFYAIEILSPNIGAKVLAAQFQYLGIVFVAPSWCLAVVRSTGQRQLLSPRRLGLLLIIPAFTLLAAFTNGYHGLLWRKLTLGNEPAPMLHVEYGPIFWLNNQYAWLLLAAGTFLLLRGTWAHYRTVTAQGAFMILTILAPWFANALYLLKLGPIPYLDLTPFAFVISGSVLFYGIARLNLTRIVPVAREYILENLQDGLFVIGNDGRLLDANGAAQRLLGDPRKQFLGLPAAQAFAKHPALAEIILAPDDATRQFQLSEQPDETFEARVNTFYDNKGAPFGRIIVCQDITARLHANERLRQSEACYRGYFELGLVGMAITSPEKGWVSFNDHLCQMLGYSREELEEMTWAELTHPRDLAADVAQFERVVRGEIDAYAMEKRFVRKDGRIVVTDLSVRCVRRPDGSVDHFLAMLHDVTLRKSTEDALRSSEAKARSILNASSANIALFDLDLHLQDCNANFARRFGLTVDDIIGRHVWQLLSRDAPNRHAALDKIFQTGEPFQSVDEYNGVWHEYTIYPIKDQAGTMTALVLYSVEITKRVALEREKDELTAQYHQAQRMEAVGQLAGGVAHDFNNLLQVILGYTEMAQFELPPSPRAREILERISTASERAASLVNQLLAFSRRQVMQIRELDINAAIAETTAMVERIIGANIRLEFLPGEELNPVRADAGLIGQVLMNLCVNARDAMPAGGLLRICTKNASPADASPEMVPNTGYVVIEISDTGIGMDAQTLEHIFEPFFTTKESGRGTGLGLATVYGIVKQHQGIIAVDSAPGGGTTFKVFLPAAQHTATANALPSKTNAAGGTETILIAEDNDMVRELVSLSLEKSGYKVLLAADGQFALDIFARHRDDIDLVLLDIVMPRLGGWEVYEVIHRERPTLPVLFSSGYQEEGIHTDFILDKDLTLIKKPYHLDELHHKIRAALQ